MTATLDVAAGLVFVYLVLSLLASAVAEAIEHFYRYRADYLRKGVETLLLGGSVELRTRLYNHPLIKSLYTQSWWEGQTMVTRKLMRAGGPSYIPTRQFVMALLDVVGQQAPDAGTTPPAGGGAPPETATAASPPTNQVTRLLEALARSERAPQQNRAIPPALANALRVLIDDADNDVEKVKANIGEWFDGSMDRVAGWYKRRAQFVLLVIGVAIAIGINADTLSIVQTLSNDSAVRAAVVAAAEARARQPLPAAAANATGGAVPAAQPSKAEASNPGTTSAIQTTGHQATAAQLQSEVKAVVSQLDTLGLPVGWRYYDARRDAQSMAPGDLQAYLIAQRIWPQWRGRTWQQRFDEWQAQFSSHLLGWLLTAFAISFGAPFWFDLLNKIMVIRSTVKPREKSREEGSEDRRVSGGGSQTVRLEVAAVK